MRPLLSAVAMSPIPAANSIFVTATPEAPAPATTARKWRARQRRGVSRVAIMPQNAGLLLASVQPRCNTRYRQQAITPINLLQLGTEKAWEYGSGLQLLR